MPGEEDSGKVKRKNVQCFLNKDRICNKDCAAYEDAPLGVPCGIVNSLRKIAQLPDMMQRIIEGGWADKLGGR